MFKEPTVRKAVDLAIQTEKVGVKFYQRLARHFSEIPEVADTFSRLSEEEKAHAARFEELLDQAPTEAPQQESERYRLEYLRAIAVSEIYRSETFEDVDGVESMEDALRLALQFERDTMHLYYGIQDTVGPHPVIDAILEEERKHVMRIAEQLQRILP